ncbi:MAG: ATP-binding protein, partial [Methylococcaceae bacterium]
ALAGKAISEDESTTIIADERKPEKPDDILPRVEEENIEEKESKTISNIVDLNTRRENISNDPDLDNTPPLSASQLGNLSSGETKAFDEIRDRLRFSTLMGATREKRARSQAMTVDTSLLDKLPVPVIVYRDDETLYANQELLTLTGYESFAELEEAGGVNALFNCDGDEVIIDKHETCLRDKDGGKMKVKALLQSVPWDEERALQLSFRQPRHENLPANEKIVLDMMRVSELQNILDTATDGIVIVDGNGIVKSINQSAETLFGKNDSDVRENHINDLFANESHKKIATYIAEIENRNADPQMKEGDDMIGINSEGSMIPLFVTIGKIGSSDKYCAVLRDMTPWKKAREELVDARLEAENASEQKTEFLARVSHEIRTPLNAIIGFSDVMIEERFGPIDNDRYREYLRDINRSGVHVLDLINDLLDISKIEAGKMELSFESVDLNKIVGETVALLQPQANGERILIRTSLSNAVPNVVADARSIRQIVLNLVSNAIKFTQSNGQVIVSTVYEGNGEVALRVRDTGRGMSKDEVIIALKPFRQISTVGDTQKGTGLGLPLTKALVEANKAHIDIESEPGEGTIIHVQFPSQRVLAG